ncbi:MAG: hypothetical protein IKO01_06700 [Kiritimatiellae bacterium]|nr:hypothetical protein [Kiritimatiellia bacterium]
MGFFPFFPHPPLHEHAGPVSPLRKVYAHRIGPESYEPKDLIDNARPPVVTLSDQEADTRTIALSFDETGRLTMQFDGVQNLTVLQTAPGSTAESHLTLEIKANELDRLASLDYTRFDDTAANEVMADKTATNKLPAAQWIPP